jgi:hypothetical protein
MPDEAAVITEILRSTGVYDWALSKVKSEEEMIVLFQDDFEGLIELCQQ